MNEKILGTITSMVQMKALSLLKSKIKRMETDLSILKSKGYTLSGVKEMLGEINLSIQEGWLSEVDKALLEIRDTGKIDYSAYSPTLVEQLEFECMSVVSSIFFPASAQIEEE